MKHKILAAVLAAAPVLVAPMAALIPPFIAGPAAAASPQSCQLPADATAKATELGARLNALRASGGLRAVRPDRDLSVAAQTQACDIAATGRFAHSGSDGSNHRTRVERTGYCAGVSGENLAWGYPTAGQIVGGWQGSPGHHKVMMLDRAGEFGVGMAQGASGPVWVLVMAQPC